MLIIKNGRVHVGNGEVLENHDVLINNDIIEKIGINLDYGDMQIIDAKDKEIFP